MQLTIKASSEQRHTVNIDDASTIKQLKEAIEKTADIPATEQRLIYSGKVLKDEEALATYGLQDGHTVHLVRSKPKGT